MSLREPHTITCPRCQAETACTDEQCDRRYGHEERCGECKEGEGREQ